MNLTKIIITLFYFLLKANLVIAENTTFSYPFYLGLITGYGSTTWQGLVPSTENQNLAISMFTPVGVDEGGAIWGFWGGYEVTPFFAFEATYVRYPRAKVYFDEISLFSFNNNNQTTLPTATETVSLFGKIMLIVPNTKVRVYSSVGAADLHRNDQLLNTWHLSPTFVHRELTIFNF